MKIVIFLMLLTLLSPRLGEAEGNIESITSSKKRAISGQVFIVTKGGESIKLGLVDISLIPKKRMLDHLAQSESARLEANDNWTSASREFMAANALWGDAIKRAKLELTDGVSPEESQAYREMKAFEAIAKIKYDKHKVAANLGEDFKSGKRYFAPLPVGIVTAKTDADGKFKLNFPAGKYALAARASRHVFDTIEEYYWLVWVDASSINIMLTNDNVFSTQCSECVKP